MEFTLCGDPLDGLHPGAFDLCSQYEACADQAPVQLDTARTAVPRAASLLGAGLVKNIPQNIEQGLTLLAEKFLLLTIDGRRDVSLHAGLNSLLARRR